MRNMEKIKQQHRSSGLIKQYTPERIGEHFTNFGATFSQIKRGNLKQGDIVIINLKLPTEIQSLFYLFSSLNYFFDFSNIETEGIYTNITFGDSFYKEAIHAIV
jgi:hypothetical protein